MLHHVDIEAEQRRQGSPRGVPVCSSNQRVVSMVRHLVELQIAAARRRESSAIAARYTRRIIENTRAPGCRLTARSGLRSGKSGKALGVGSGFGKAVRVASYEPLIPARAIGLRRRMVPDATQVGHSEVLGQVAETEQRRTRPGKRRGLEEEAEPRRPGKFAVARDLEAIRLLLPADDPGNLLFEHLLVGGGIDLLSVTRLPSPSGCAGATGCRRSRPDELVPN